MFPRLRLNRLNRQHLFQALRRGAGRRSAQARQASFVSVMRTDSLEARTMLAGDMWMPLGPFSATDGQVENVGTDDRIAGATHVVLAHPTNADILYVGATNGGIWRTNDATATNPSWTPLTDDQASLSMGAMTFDVSDATNQTIVAGIGRYSSFGRTGGDRTGLLKTTDGGTTWQAIDGGGTLTGKNISGVYADGNTIVVSVNVADSFTYSNIGIFRSTDGGATFTRISSGDGSTTGLPGGVSYDLVADPVTAGTLYTSTVFSSGVGGQNGIYKSTDAGASWTLVSDATINALVTDSTTNLEMAVGRHNNVYAAVIVTGNPVGFFRSGDGGATWTQLDSPSTNENGIDVGLNPRGQKGPDGTAAPEELAGGQGSIHFSIVADPTDPDVVFVGGDRQPRTNGDAGTFPNSIGATDFSGRMFRGDASLAAGSQWVHITHSNTLGAAGGGTASSSSPHADSREMTFDANGDLIEVNDGGVYRRTQPRSDQGDWFALTGDIQITEAHDVAWDAISNVAMTGNQDTGSTYQTGEGVALWDSLSTADGGDIAIDDVSLAGSNQSIRYSSFQNLGAFRRTTWNAAGTLTGTVFPAVTVSSGAALDPAFVTPVVLNTVDPTRLIIQGDNSVYESFNQGDSIAEVGVGVGITGFQSGIAYGGFQSGVPNADVLWATTASDVYFRSTAGPLAVVGNNVTSGTIRDLAIDLDDWSNAFVIDDNEVRTSTDSGQTWQTITGTLAGMVDDFRSLAYVAGPTVDAVLLGTGSGMFAAATSALTTWVPLGTGMPNVPIFDVEYDVADNVLVAGTLGRGAWMLDDVVGAVEGLFGSNTDPVISDQTLSVPENSPNATTVGTVVANDADAGQTLTYAITAGNGVAPGAFAINNSGVVTVADSAQLDFEMTPQFSLTVTVTDDAMTPASDSATITIDVTDVDDTNDAPFINLGLTGADNRAEFYGNVPFGAFGGGVAGVGDTNNDGFDDFLVASTSETGGASSSGVARVFSGRDGSVLLTLPGFDVISDFGENADGIGDITGDGHDDFVIAAPDEMSGQGAVRVFSGADGSILNLTRGVGAAADHGESVGAAGDVNNDGVPDYIVGAPDEQTASFAGSGVVTVYSGADFSVIHRFEADDFFQDLGSAVGGAGDINGDGFDDIIVGAAGGGSSSHGNIGFAEIRSGADGSILRTFNGSGALDRFGESVANVGDINGNGTDDFAIGEPVADGAINRAGAVFVFDGGTGALLHRFDGQAANSDFGEEVASAGDFDNDGTGDILVGAPDDDTGNGANGATSIGLAGSVTIFSGADGSVLFQENGGASSDRVGSAVANAGDLNGDGRDDLVFGTQGDDTVGTSTGKATVLYSAPIDDPPANFVQAGGPVSVIDNLVITDQDDVNLTQAVVQITGNYANTEDVLALSGAALGGISVGAFNVGSGSITLTGTASIADYIGTLKLITYNNLTVSSTATRTVTVVVTDENSIADPIGMLNGVDTRDIEVFLVNNPPTIDDQTFNIDENLANTLLVGNVVATEPDAGQSLTYAITAGNGVAPGAFTIDNNGALRVNDSAQLDFETTPTFSLTITVTDDGFPVAMDSATITVNLNDVNDRPTIAAQTLTIDENSVVMSVVGTVVANDDDNDNLTFAITAGNGTAPGAFAITNTGEISVNESAQLDFETTPTFTLTVTATDDGTGMLVGSGTVTVNLNDVNENPVVDDQTFTVNESAANATVVGTVVATDVDAGQGRSFAITAGNGVAPGVFAIDNAGEITVIGAAQLDFETTPTYSLTVLVTDDGTGMLTDTATITINVNDQNESPTIAPQTFSVDENSVNTTVVGTVLADDEENDNLTFAIAAGNGVSPFAFAIDNSGQITVNDTAQLDFETTPTFTLTVTATDDGTGMLAGSGTVTVNLNDVNENPVVDDQTFSVSENAADATVVGTVAASDVDAGQTLSFSITAGNGTAPGAFAIDNTGEITVADSDQLDFETTPQFNLTVLVTDDGTGMLTDQATITINVSDLNDPPLVLDQIFRVDENSANTTSVGQVVVTEDDGGDTLTFSFTQGNGIAPGAFAIDNNGQITVNDATQLDFETTPQFTVTVLVQDDGVGMLTDTATITINLNDLNEAPVVADQTFDVDENSSSGAAVGTVVVTEADAGQTLTYAITAGNGSPDIFAIDANGQITVSDATQLNFEDTAQYMLTVEVTDDGAGTLSDSATITIDINDVNEAPVANDAIFSIVENSASGTPVGTVTASDVDASQLRTFDIIAGNGFGRRAFLIDNNTGQITVNDTAQIDFETTQQFILTVEVTDTGSPQLTDVAFVTINVSDVDDTNDAPVLTLGTPVADPAIQYTEDDPAVDVIDNILVTDTDDSLLSSASIQITGNYIADEDFLNLTVPLPTGISSVGFNPLDGSITFTGIASFANYYTALRQVTYSNFDVTSSATRTVTVSVTDANITMDPAGPQTATATRDIELTEAVLTLAITDAEIAENGGTTTATVTRNTDITEELEVTLSSNDTSEATVPMTVIIPANAASVQFTITGEDDLLGDGTQTVTITASHEGYVDGTDTLDVLDENEFPIVDDQTFSVDENSANASVVGTIAASDANAGTKLTFTVTSGNEAGAFAVDSNGQITVADSSLLDFETAQPFVLNVTVTDDGSPQKSDTAVITINVVDLNESPIVLLGNVVPDGPLSYTQDDAPVPVFDNVSVTDIDDTTLTQAVVQISGNYTATEDRLALQGVLPPAITAGSFNVANGSLTLTGSASIADYQAALLLVTYRNRTVNNTAPRTVTLTVTDANAILDPNGPMSGSSSRQILLTQLFDYGDAPFQTLIADNGPQHHVTDLFLGASIDFDTDGQPTADATGDDADAAGDDENGISFITPIAQGQGTYLEVRSSGPGTLAGWVDFNQNQVFEQNERYVWTIGPGISTVSFASPRDAVLGETAVRFRLSSDRQAVLSPTGSAPDGEVEDYVRPVVGTQREFGDAPESYGTSRETNGAFHNLGSNTHWLGQSRDLEAEANPTDDASGDTDDGVQFMTDLARHQPTTVMVTASEAGELAWWVDFDKDGTFNDTTERFSQSIDAGPNAVVFFTPGDAVVGDTFTRFRFSSDANSVVSALGRARDGEVEDYAVEVFNTQREYGDAPESYGVGITSGAYHNLGSNRHWLGESRDLEATDGASPNADGDIDDGVTFLTPLAQRQPTIMQVVASEAGELGYWIDFDGNGTFDNPAERFSQSLEAGVNRVVFTTPAWATIGDTFARFRFSSTSAGVEDPTGRARDGEVEDYAVEVLPTQFEFGDAPASYGTTSEDGGAFHKRGSGQVYLGSGRDLEANGIPSNSARADDNRGDDEDGITFLTPTTSIGQASDIPLLTVGREVTFSAIASTAGVLTWWLDSDFDGSFDTNGERFRANLDAGENELSFNVPVVLGEGATYMRFRFNRTEVSSPVGGTSDGEVEDYRVSLQRPGFVQASDAVFEDEEELASLLASLAN